MKPENAGQLHECGSARTEMNFEASHEKVGRQETVLAHERHDLIRGGEKGDQVDESEQPQDDETSEPIRWSFGQRSIAGYRFAGIRIWRR